MRTPRRRNVARFFCVASCCHMFTFMAGATITGAVVARYNVERKSEAVPLANLASVSAVAGATSNASIDCATPICSTEEPAFARRRSVGKHVRDDIFARERREGQRTHELLRRAGHHHLYLDAAVLQLDEESQPPCKRRFLRLRPMRSSWFLHRRGHRRAAASRTA